MHVRVALHLIVALLAVEAASAQNEAVLAELKKLDERVSRPGVLIAPDEAREVDSRLRGWSFEAESLKPGPRAQLRRLQTLIYLQRGDAANAQSAAADLLAQAGADALSADIVFQAACAAADGQLAAGALKVLAAAGDAEAKKRAAQRKRGAAQIGRRIADAQIRIEDGTEIDLQKRGSQALVLDVWNMLAPPTDAHRDALKRLHQTAGRGPELLFVGLNADNDERTEKARAFAAEHYPWGQRFEGVGVNAPLTHQKLRAGAPPWAMVIDHYGFVRAVGDASDIAFEAALRAAAAEAAGVFEPIVPRGADGKQPERRSAAAEVSPTGGAKAAPAEGPKSNPEAASKLRQAITYRKTGLKTKARELLQQIVAEYPGTKEAEEAALELELLQP